MRIPSPALAALVLSAAAVATVDAQPLEGAAELTLERAVEIALSSNLALQAAAEGVAAREAEARVARSARRPQLEASVTASRSTNPVLVFGQLLGQEAFTEQNFDVAFLNEPDPLSNVLSRVAARQVLWSGGRLKQSIASAGLAHDEETAVAARVRQQVIERVIDAYGDAVLARSRQLVALKARETARAHVKLASDLHEAGLVVRSDVLRARVRSSEVEQLVVESENQVIVTLAALNLILGVGLDTPHSLPDALDDALAATGPEPVSSTPSLIETATAGRPDLAASARRLEAAASAARLARSERRPEVGISASYDANAETFVGADGSSWTVMLAARMSVLDGGATSARIRAAEARRRAAAHQHEQLRRSVELEVRHAVSSLRSATARVDQSRIAVELAQENLRIVEDRYREGLTTLTELLDAETSLTRSRTGHVTAQRDQLAARASLDLATGRL